MFQTRTSVRLLNYLGIGLVALPEPFTTPFGVALLFIAHHLSKRLELVLKDILPEISAYQSYWFKRPSGSNNPEELKRYLKSEPRPIPGQYGFPEASAYQSYWFKPPRDYADSDSGDAKELKRYNQSEQNPITRQYGLPGASAYQSYWFKRSADEASLSAEQTRHQRRDRGQEAAPPIGEPFFFNETSA
jgi:hypothetical protein